MFALCPCKQNSFGKTVPAGYAISIEPRCLRAAHGCLPKTVAGVPRPGGGRDSHGRAGVKRHTGCSDVTLHLKVKGVIFKDFEEKTACGHISDCGLFYSLSPSRVCQ